MKPSRTSSPTSTHSAWLGLVVASLLASPAAAQASDLATRRPDGTQFTSISALFGEHSLSGDGRFVVFPGNDPSESFPKGLYVRDLALATTSRLVGIGHAEIQYSAIDGDGDVTAFSSGSLDLPTPFNGWTQVWVVEGGSIELVSHTVAGARATGHSVEARLSADGQRVAYASSATNLTAPVPGGKYNIFLYDRSSGSTTHVSPSLFGGGPNQNCSEPRVSANGMHVAFRSFADDLVPGDTNLAHDIFVRDVAAGATVRVSVSTGGVQANGTSGYPAISASGRFVAFQSAATNLGSPVAGIFVHDRDADGDGIFDEPGAIETVPVSVDSLGANASGQYFAPEISGNGRRIVFLATSTGLVANPPNGFHVYLHDRKTGQTTQIDVDANGVPANDVASVLPVTFTGYGTGLSTDGKVATFVSKATNLDLVYTDTNGDKDVYAHTICRDPSRQLGHWLAPLFGPKPEFSICGSLKVLQSAEFRLRNAAPGTTAILLLTDRRDDTPYFGGTLVPAMKMGRVMFGGGGGTPPTGVTVTTDANGSATVVYPGGGGWKMYGQWIVLDPNGPQGRTLSNALEITWGS